MKPHILTLTLVVAFLVLQSPASAQAKLFTVNSSADASDALPADGICADASGECTLRAAIEESNSSAGTQDIIIFSLPQPAVIDLTIGPLTVTGAGISIVGPGARRVFVLRFTGGTQFRIFHIPNSGTSAVIRGISIHDGISGLLIAGGAIRTGPGTTLYLADVSVRNNTGGSGGAILNEGTMTITRSLFASNAANANGGAIATTSTSVTRIYDSTITGNSATSGGGIYAEGPVLLVNDTISHNSAANSASGVRSGSANEVAMLNTIVGSDVSLPVTSLSGTFLSHGNNIVTDARTSTGFANGVNNDQVSDNNVINPMLGPLANNGGQTDTRQLLNGSPAINAGNSCVFLGQCSMIPGPVVRLAWDQRAGFTRGGILNAVDIGAFESGNVGSSGSGTVGGFVAVGIRSFLYNSQAVLINVETGERQYSSIGPSGNFRFTNVPSAVVHVVDFRSKRAGTQAPPFVLAVPD